MNATIRTRAAAAGVVALARLGGTTTVALVVAAPAGTQSAIHY